jgi:hypothetical protein
MEVPFAGLQQLCAPMLVLLSKLPGLQCDALGYSAITAGISQRPLAGGIIAAAGLASPIVSRYGTRRVLVAGLAFFAAGPLWFAQLPARGTYLGSPPGPSLVIALGLGLTFVLITILAMTELDDRY